jgi:hypothetical protein
VKWFGKRWWRVAFWAGTFLVLSAIAVILPPLIQSSRALAEYERYASICTRCGVQTAEDFYLVLGTEVLRREKVLGASKLTQMRTTENCSHETALIGKSLSQLHKNFALGQLKNGQTKGWMFRGEDLSRHLAEMRTMRPGESMRYVNDRSILQANAPVRTNTARATAF